MESILRTQYLFRARPQDLKQMQKQEFKTDANSIRTVLWLQLLST